MSAHPLPFASTTQRGISRWPPLRGLKIILLLVGLMLSLQVLQSSPEWIALLALTDPIDPIVLFPTESIHLKSEMVFPQMHMLNSSGFTKLTADKHVWAYLQIAEVGDHSGLVYFFKFNDESEALECVNAILASQDFTVPHEGRQFGHYAVLAISILNVENPSPFFDTVFGQITQNMAHAGYGFKNPLASPSSQSGYQPDSLSNPDSEMRRCNTIGESGVSIGET